MGRSNMRDSFVEMQHCGWGDLAVHTEGSWSEGGTVISDFSCSAYAPPTVVAP
ncbi:hypothetical protein AAFF_G00172430, partial [Aldrovandia affinis]